MSHKSYHLKRIKLKNEFITEQNAGKFYYLCDLFVPRQKCIGNYNGVLYETRGVHKLSVNFDRKNGSLQ